MDIMNKKSDELQPYTVEEAQDHFVTFLKTTSLFLIESYEMSEDSTSWRESLAIPFIESFHKFMAGIDMQFPIGFKIMVTPNMDYAKTFDINDGELHHTNINLIKEIRKNLESALWGNFTEEFCHRWHVKLAELVEEIDKENMSDSEKIDTFIYMLLKFIENGDEIFGNIELDIVSRPGHMEWMMDNGKRYFPNGMQITHYGTTLAEQYDGLGQL